MNEMDYKIAKKLKNRLSDIVSLVDFRVFAEHRMTLFFQRGGLFSGTTYLEVIFHCPSQECSRLFTAIYEASTVESQRLMENYAWLKTVHHRVTQDTEKYNPLTPFSKGELGKYSHPQFVTLI